VTSKLLLFGALFTYGTCVAAIISVPADSASIQAGISGASAMDTVHVAPGVYIENVSFLGKAILVRSTGGRDSTFIEPADTSLAIVSFSSGEDTNSTIDGFTFRYARGVPAASCSGTSPNIQNCDFTECRASTGSAVIKCDSSAARIISNRIYACRGDSSAEWACIRLSGASVSSPCVIENSIHDNLGGMVYGIVCANLGSGALIMHNLIWGNYSDDPALGSGIRTAQSIGSKIINNTVVANTRGIVSIDRKKVAFDFDSTDIRNNIIAYNFMEGLDAISSKHDYNNIFNNGVEPWELAPREIAVDPLFVDAANHDYGLQPISPCINSGDPDSAYHDPDGSCADMGALYFDLSFMCGDANNSDEVDIDDIMYLIEYIFSSGSSPIPYESGNADCLEMIDIDDVVYLINYVFSGGPPPCAPCSPG
jgi:hypothetical protein